MYIIISKSELKLLLVQEYYKRVGVFCNIKDYSPLPGQKALPGLESAEDKRGQEGAKNAKGKDRR